MVSATQCLTSFLLLQLLLLFTSRIMDKDDCKAKLSEAGVSEATIQLLLDEEMLECQCLKLATNELLRAVGLKGGQIVAIRKAFPNIQEQEAPPLPSMVHQNDKRATPGVHVPIQQENASATLPEQEKPALSTSPGQEKPAVAFIKSPPVSQSLFSFELPDIATLSPRVQEGLKNENLIDVARNEYIRDVCNVIRQITLYPTLSQRERVAHLIVTTYPFLKDSVGSGFGSWEKAIHFRLKNIRKNGKGALNKRLLPDDTLDKTSPHGSKKSKSVHVREELLPSLPEGETSDTMADHLKKMVKEMEKPRGRNLSLIKQLMDISFPLRRREIVGEPKAVEDITKKYPALKLPTEQKRELGRILGNPNLAKECSSTFLSNWAEKIVTYGRKSPLAKNTIYEMTASFDEDNRKEIESSAAIIILTNLLKEKKGCQDAFLKIVTDDDEDGIDHYIQGTKAPRIVGYGNVFKPDPLYICIEGKAVVGPLSGVNLSLVEASVILLACYYTFNIEYPQPKNVFIFLEAIMLNKTSTLKGRIGITKLLSALNSM